MNLARALRALGATDVRNVRRDPLLGWLVFYPVVLALALRWGIPPLAAWLLGRYGFDLRPLYPLVASGVIGLAPGMVGIVVGFLLLDERDERTLTALLVTPLPVHTYLAYRIGLPTLLGFAVTLITYPLTGLAPVPLPVLLASAALAALLAPLTALCLAAFARNKLAGFALVKVLNGVNLLPTLAWFLEMPLQLAAGVVPGYWAMKMIWAGAAGEPVAGVAAAGVVVNVAALAMLTALFRRRTLDG